MRLLHSKTLAILALAALPAPSTAQVPLAPQAPATRQRLPHGMSLLDVGHGFGQLLPHRVAELDAQGQPTGVVLDVRDLSTLIEHLRPGNEILPAPIWPQSATLPGGAAGNHFLVVRFDQVPDIDFILDPDPAAAATSQLLGTLTLVAVNPQSGSRTPVQGRAFVGGRTYAGTPVGVPPVLPQQAWILYTTGGPVANPAVDNDGDGVPDGLGFPGTEAGAGFAGDALLALPNAFVFVADSDGDLRTHETFPTGVELVVEISSAIHAEGGATLDESALASATVGPDLLPPELRFLPPASMPDILPRDGEQNVDPETTLTLSFTESLRVTSFGTLTGAGPADVSSALSLEFGPAFLTTSVPYTVLPMSAWDLSRVVLTPAFPFPGGGPVTCGDFSLVGVTVNPTQVQDLSINVNLLAVTSSFHIGPGPGLVNAPVAPDAIYAGRLGARVGISVIDLNGFGAGTGDPTYDPMQVIEGNSNYPNNPNLRFQGSLLRPPLAPGNCTLDGGSAGVYTTTRDSSLDDLLASSPLLQGASDMALGASLDLAFDNAPAPFGCQSGGGNLCALDGLQLLSVAQGGPSTLQPTPAGGSPLHIAGAAGNVISFAPHPNPPPLVFPPLCVAPHLGAQEPTSIESSSLLGLVNLLAPGDPFGVPAAGIPPSGLLTREQNAFFQGPSLPALQITQCTTYMQRQHVGQFLYVIDRVRRQVVVLDSNRMVPIDRIDLADPTELAMAPNLDLLAVTNQSAGTVDFIDVDPLSAGFHEIVQTTSVGSGPRGIAWDSGNEDVLVCNEGDGGVSILSAFTLGVRKVLSSHLTQPFAIALTPRQQGFGFQRNVYFGYILNRNGACAIFESGPDGLNGWGYDDIIGRAPYIFRQPKALQPDVTALTSAVWILHEGEIDTQTGQAAPAGTGAASRLGVQNASVGQLPLAPGSQPQLRAMALVVDVSLGTSVLSGIPIDLAFDDQRNLGALPGVGTPFGAGAPATVNSKGLVRQVSGSLVSSSTPQSLFVAIPNPTGVGVSVVDVIDLASFQRRDTNAFQPGVQSIPMPGVISLANYFRQ